MKKLVLISGAAGVGKTTLCKELFKSIEGCAWLDADWCWMIHPWKNKTEAQKSYVEATFARILRGYLENEDIHTVLFCWVMPFAWVFDRVTEPLCGLEFELYKIALVCGKETHMERMKKDGRREEQVRLPGPMEPYYRLGAEVIDISEISVAETVRKVLCMIHQNEGES